MPTDDRTHSNALPDSDATPAIQDLSPNELDPRAAEQVKGGRTPISDMSFVHKVDKASPVLL